MLTTKASRSDAINERERRNRQLAYEAAVEGIVLLENNGVLPLKPCPVALFGAVDLLAVGKYAAARSPRCLLARRNFCRSSVASSLTVSGLATGLFIRERIYLRSR